MRKERIVAVMLLAAAGALRAQDDGEGATDAAGPDDGALIEAGDAITLDLCERMRDDVIPRIEQYTRMRFRRPVPVQIQPKAVWDRAREADFAGLNMEHTLAYYTPGSNVVTVIPWVIGGYTKPKPDLKTRQAWVEELEPTMIHELTHALHHQNFYTEGRHYAASMRHDGLSEEEIDRATVEFLIGEGVPELVSLRTTDYPHRMGRHPRAPDGIARYMHEYQPDGKQPYRVILLAKGYVDGLNLMHATALRTGARGIRAIMYRQPPRALLFQPDILAKVDLDDPPDPDSILGFLAPEVLDGTEVHLAVNPGFGRYFSGACRRGKAPGCLIGYVTEVGEAGDESGRGRYAFFVADPDEPGGWSEAQAKSLRALAPEGVEERSAKLPHVDDPVDVRLLEVALDDGGRYLRVETGGLVVLGHESKPTKTLEDRALLALRALWIRRPKPNLYDEAMAQALQSIPK